MVRDANRLRLLPPPEALPAPGFRGTWSRHAKARVVRAIQSGQITIGEAQEAWGMNIDEIVTWTDRYNKGGVLKLGNLSDHLRQCIDEDRAMTSGETSG